MKNMYSVNGTIHDLLANEEVKNILVQEIPEIVNDERNKDSFLAMNPELSTVQNSCIHLAPLTNAGDR